MRFLFLALCFLVPPPLPVPLFTLPRSLVAMADAIVGMANIHLPLLLRLYIVSCSARCMLHIPSCTLTLRLLCLDIMAANSACTR
jgi:hypothetical protein